MKITINDHPLELVRPITLAELLKEHHYLASGTALAVNKKIIHYRQWADYRLQDGDDILLFQAITGG